MPKKDHRGLLYQTLSIPAQSAFLPLYADIEGPCRSISFDEQTIHGGAGTRVSCNTYFNSIYESYIAELTSADSIRFVLRFKGSVKISVFRESLGGCECVYELAHRHGALKELAIELPLAADSRLWLEYEFLSDALIYPGEVYLCSPQTPAEVNLAICICTYKKEEYITRTLRALFESTTLKKSRAVFTVYIADNGGTLNLDKDIARKNVRLIANRNTGGSGGFTRALYEAVQSRNHTHYLFMDDDVVLDPEVINKTIALFALARGEVMIAGTMFDGMQKSVIHESGTAYNPHTLRYIPHKCGLSAEYKPNLKRLLMRERNDFAGWWYCAFSEKTRASLGYPLQMFIRADDTEWGLRFTAGGGSICAVPGIALHHEPFYFKDPVWIHYYRIKNLLIVNAVHYSTSVFAAIALLLVYYFTCMLCYDYGYLLMVLSGIEDFLKGPRFVEECDYPLFHKELIAKSAAFTESVQLSAAQIGKISPKKRGLLSILLAPLMLLTMNGQLIGLPFGRRCITQHKANKGGGITAAASTFYAKEIVYYNPYNHTATHYRRRPLLFFKLTLRTVKVVLQLLFNFRRVSERFRTRAPYLSSEDFWKEFFEKE